MGTRYEWIVEEVDADLDVIDTCAWDTAADAARYMREHLPADGSHFEFGLTRNVGDDDVGLQDREWAYVEPPAHVLPERFDGGAAVPKRFIAELAAATVDWPR